MFITLYNPFLLVFLFFLCNLSNIFTLLSSFTFLILLFLASSSLFLIPLIPVESVLVSLHAVSVGSSYPSQ